MLKKLLGLAPKLERDGSYSPSKIALKLSTSSKTDFEDIQYEQYQGKKSKILVVFTEQKDMIMKNGKKFSTGNHPVEALVPMLHLRNAGFKFEIATSSGKPAVLEMWAFPNEDKHVQSIYNEYKSHLEQPMRLRDFVENSMSDVGSYAAVFIPGGHGAMLGLPEDEHLGKILNWAHDNDLYTLSICHGPSAFLATTLNNQKFLYTGYEMAVFPDSVDKNTPMIGYLPGHMPWGLSERLKKLGAKLANKKADATVCLDRKLITGASPSASNALGKLAANTLLKELKP